MKQRLLNFLACPECRQSLECETLEEHSEEILEGKLFCANCRQAYPIRRGIPRLLPNDLSAHHQETAQAFGWQWTHFVEMHATFEHQFLNWIAPIQPEFFNGKIVLDAGCGIGRHVYCAAGYGAQEVIGVDISDAVETAFKNVGCLPNVHVVQASLLKPPFKLNTFDFIYSIGVLHHLPDPEAGFRALVEFVKRGGTIFAWVYGYEGNAIVHRVIDPLRRTMTSRLPFALLMPLSYAITIPLQIAVKGIYRPLNRIGFKALPYNDYLYHLSDFSFRKNHTIVFDHLVPPIAFYVKREEFEDWFIKAGLHNVEISWRNKNSWRGRGAVP
ncbi:MAG: methyltransferase domain-containing protein [Chloroflexi bacterium]|nr:methyltransferase domain-containing protein [Chloroflexota bacterium]